MHIMLAQLSPSLSLSFFSFSLSLSFCVLSLSLSLSPQPRIFIFSLSLSLYSSFSPSILPPGSPATRLAKTSCLQRDRSASPLYFRCIYTRTNHVCNSACRMKNKLAVSFPCSMPRVPNAKGGREARDEKLPRLGKERCTERRGVIERMV